MFHKLDKNEYQRVRRLFKELDYNLTASAVIDGTSPGRIYVDNENQPKTAFICSVEGYYLAGKVDNDAFNESLNKLIFDVLFAGDTVRKGETDVAIGFHPGSWTKKMGIIFRGRRPLLTSRRHYICNELRDRNWRNQIPDGFQVQRINRKLLKKRGLKIPEHMTGWMKTNWNSIPNFLEKGVGFCTLHGNKIASWSITDCISGKASEVGIRTHGDYRRQGLATMTASAIVDYYLSNGFKYIGWHCDEYNLPSRKTAERVGFRLERKYIQYYACSNEAHHLEEIAQTQFRAKKYKEAIESYEQFLLTPEDKLPKWFRKVLPQRMGTHYFRIAYAKAAIGESIGALEYLEKAVDKGWLHIDFLKTCKEFENMYGTPAWNRILEKIRKKLAEP